MTERKTTRRRVLVVQRRLTHYRLPFFSALRTALASADVDLVLACGNGTQEEDSKDDGGKLDWAVPLPTRYFANGRICVQPFSRIARDCDMVVVALENKLVCNLPEQFGRTGRRLALWGHGANLQGDPGSAREKFKRRVARQADWWFGYTELSIPHIRRSGFPEHRITILNNAVDTSQMRTQRAAVTPDRLAHWRRELNLAGNSTGIYVGSLYDEKRIPFMLEAAAGVRQRVPDFEFLIVGAGPDSALVKEFCAKNAWARYLGPRKGTEKVELLALARVMLNPGLVGLGILDSFICEVPLVTTDCGLHSPEIAYLESGVNGLMCADDPATYVQAVVDVLTDAALLARLRDGCARSGRKYTVEQMAANFSAGVVAALDAPIHRFGKGA